MSRDAVDDGKHPSIWRVATAGAAPSTLFLIGEIDDSPRPSCTHFLCTSTPHAIDLPLPRVLPSGLGVSASETCNSDKGEETSVVFENSRLTYFKCLRDLKYRSRLPNLS